MELLTLGQLGSDLAFVVRVGIASLKIQYDPFTLQTDSLSTMYYQTQWEQVLYYSTNPRENLRLLKVVALAIELNCRTFYMTGLKYFRVSLQAVVKVVSCLRLTLHSTLSLCLFRSLSTLQILQGAFSYFTFLTSMR